MGLKGNKINHAPSHKRPVNGRRISALRLLEAQLSSGVKPVKKSFTETEVLTEKDITRINREISILKAKIIS